jgi:hypothetical protein
MQTRSQPSPRPPPPPPPPPPRNSPPIAAVERQDEQEWEVVRQPEIIRQPPPQQQQPQQQQQQHRQHQQPLMQQRRASFRDSEVQTDPPAPWVLTVRPPRRTSGPYLPGMIQIEITPNTTTTQVLANCLNHALRDSSIVPAGLFVEDAGIFRSLQDILNGQTPQYVYTLYLEEPPPKPQRAPGSTWVQTMLSSLTPVACLGLVYYYYEHITQTASDSLVLITQTASDGLLRIYEATMHEPLTYMYRYGPWFLGGWSVTPGYKSSEQSELANICARLTEYGDSTFWSRNLEDCQRIYSAKEEAYIRVAQPVLYFVVALIILASVRFCIWEMHRIRAMHAQQQRPMDRDMVETFRAMQILMQQAKRTWSGQQGGPAANTNNRPRQQ